jgi:C-terminal processing protease CtpA/Prc
VVAEREKIWVLGKIAAGMFCIGSGLAAAHLGAEESCQAPRLFGLCDPFVPGTIVAWQGERRPLRVVSTWPNGPAETAGVCPGDLIIGVNGVTASDNTQDRMLKEIVSSLSTPVVLKVKREDKELQFTVERVRETTLAKLSRQKYIRWQWSGGDQAEAVPLDERPEELLALAAFRARLDAQVGFGWRNERYVPTTTPQAQLEELESVMSSARVQGRVGSDLGPETYGTGFTAVVLADPAEVVVERVDPETPAHLAGLLPGDRLVAVDGRGLPGLAVEKVQKVLFGPGRTHDMRLTVKRGDSQSTFNLKTRPNRELAETKAWIDLPIMKGPRSADDYLLGADVLYARSSREAIVERVEYPSPAFDAGLHLGDEIIAVNGKPIKALPFAGLNQALSTPGPLPTMLVISRLGRTHTFRLAPATYGKALADIGRKSTKFGPAPEHCP